MTKRITIAGFLENQGQCGYNMGVSDHAVRGLEMKRNDFLKERESYIMKRLISAMMALCLLSACQGTLAQAAETYPFTGYVTMDKVYFRSGPSTQSASYGFLSRGTSVRVTGEKGGFYAVTYQSRSGYILKSLVTRTVIPPEGDGSAYICMDKVYFRKAAHKGFASVRENLKHPSDGTLRVSSRNIILDGVA